MNNDAQERQRRQAQIRGLVLFLAAIVLGVGGAAWEAASPTGPRTSIFASISYRAMLQRTVGVPQPRTGLVPTSDNQGQVLFGRYCDSCHPAGRVGIGADLRSRQVKRQYTIADQIAKVVRKGGYDMPAFPPDLVSDKELAQISRYVLSLPEESR